MNWKSLPLAGKIALIISALSVLVWLICRIEPDLFGIDLSYPAISVFTVCEAVLCWKNRRAWSYILIAGAVISFACFVLEQIL